MSNFINISDIATKGVLILVQYIHSAVEWAVHQLGGNSFKNVCPFEHAIYLRDGLHFYQNILHYPVSDFNLNFVDQVNTCLSLVQSFHCG